MSDRELLGMRKIYWELVNLVKNNEIKCGENKRLDASNVDVFFYDILGKKDWDRMFEVKDE